MTPTFDTVVRLLKQLPGLGHRSGERLALHLLVERSERLNPLVEALSAAAAAVRRCGRCGNLAEEELCVVCADGRRDPATVCVVEQVPDLAAIERSAAYGGVYHVLHGKLSPINGVGPDHLNLATLSDRLSNGEVSELILALSNDVEGEATCHYITSLLPDTGVKFSRIGFGLPSGGGVVFADAVTLKNALDGRREYH